MCVSPYIVKGKNGELMPVPCGHCYECLEQWSKDWRFRLNVEKRDSAASVFLTLTYNDAHIPVAFNDDAGEWQSYVDKRELQLFFKRVRKNCPDLKFRYFAIGEYGGKYNRAHYHVVFFFYNTAGLTLNQLYWLFHYCWQGRGFIYLKPTENKQINYVSGYFNKIDTSSHIVKPFKLMSKSIGKSFLSQRMIDYFFRTFKSSLPNPFGKGYSKLPRYYRKKLDEIDIWWREDAQTWSEVVRLQPYTPKGVMARFKEFCDNYNDIFRDVYRNEIHLMRTQGFQLPNLENPNEVLKIWASSQPDIIDARVNDWLSLDKAKVKHKYTKLNEITYLYG